MYFPKTSCFKTPKHAVGQSLSEILPTCRGVLLMVYLPRQILQKLYPVKVLYLPMNIV